MIVFGISAFVLHPDWGRVLKGAVPAVTPSNSRQTLLYWYFAVGIFSALFMAYEVHFYSSGAIEEDWKPKDLGQNVMVASVGSILGSWLTTALVVLGAIVLLPRHIFPELLGTTIWVGSFPFGTKALIVAICGTLACIGGAAIETTLSCAYNVCQFFNLAWGKNRPVREVPIFTAIWIVALALAFLIAVTGVSPFTLVDISIVFGMAVMPFTYHPILRIAANKKRMGSLASGRLKNVIGAAFLVLITAAAIAAIPLMIVTHSGRP
jgi:Mn2+/Fe2+ NRAMP family transporter